MKQHATEHPAQRTSPAVEPWKLDSRPWLDPQSSRTEVFVWDTKRTRLSKAIRISLDQILPDGTNLLDEINEDWLRLVHKYINLLRDDSDIGITTGETHATVVERLLTFLKWSRLQGIYDLRRMTPELVETFSGEIAQGTGHALRYTERINRFLENAKGHWPFVSTKASSKRKQLDVKAICKAVHISNNGLSRDSAATQLLSRIKAQHGFAMRKNARKAAGAPVPIAERLTRATHSRFVHAIRYLHKWNGRLEGRGLSFMPLATKADSLGSSKLTVTGHTKNIPPLDAMRVLDGSLRWVHIYGPRTLDLFDEVEAFYLRECKRAESLDRWQSRDFVDSLHVALNAFLRSENETGRVPRGCIKLIMARTQRGADISRRILAGAFTKQSRAAAMLWLKPEGTTSDDRLSQLARKEVSMHSLWSSSWPYSIFELAKQIGTGPMTLKRFIEKREAHDVAFLERVESFLVARNAIGHVLPTQARSKPSYRSDRGIESRLEQFVATHPLNQPSDEGGPWPLIWNIKDCSRQQQGITLYEALRYCIPSAALCVLGVFQARRESELSSLLLNSISEEDGQIWLESHIAKTLRKDKKLPTVRVAATSVALLTRWGERGRRQTGSQKLFSYWDPLGGVVTVVSPNDDLNRFVGKALPTPISGRLQIRQFRRFFAVTYMWRYRLGSLPALSDFLCHSGLTMTWEYVTERVGTSVMIEAQADFSREMLVGAAIGRVQLRGPFARTWGRWVEKVQAKIKRDLVLVDMVGPEDRLFRERVESGMRLLMPTPWGFCAAGNRERDNRRAKCAVPDPAAAGRLVKKPEFSRPEMCASCPFSATDEVHRDKWESNARDARAAANSPVPSIVRKHARVVAPQLERFIKIFSIDTPNNGTR